MSRAGDDAERSDEKERREMSTDEKTAQQDVEAAPDLEPSDGVEIDKTAEETDAARHDSVTAKLRRRVIVAPLVLALLLVVSGALAGWVYVAKYRPDQQTDAAAAQTALDAARDGIVALLSYKPETLSQDISAAKSHLTGDFLNYYDQFTRDVVTPAAQQKKLTTTAQVVGAAVSELHPNSAVVLLFVNQATVSKDRPDPAMASSTLLVSLTKLHDKWLISKFQPI
jgi:Mce-associated membrane protein